MQEYILFTIILQIIICIKLFWKNKYKINFEWHRTFLNKPIHGFRIILWKQKSKNYKIGKVIFKYDWKKYMKNKTNPTTFW